MEGQHCEHVFDQGGTALADDQVATSHAAELVWLEVSDLFQNVWLQEVKKLALKSEPSERIDQGGYLVSLQLAEPFRMLQNDSVFNLLQVMLLFLRTHAQ